MGNLLNEHGEIIISGIVSVALLIIMIAIMLSVSNMYESSVSAIIGA